MKSESYAFLGEHRHVSGHDSLVIPNGIDERARVRFHRFDRIICDLDKTVFLESKLKNDFLLVQSLDRTPCLSNVWLMDLIRVQYLIIKSRNTI